MDWLTKWDTVKAHDTLIDWCTGREWPLNCMTVISAWRSNMPFQRLSGRLNYYITWWDWKSASLRSDELETRCGRVSQHSAESWGPRPPVEQQKNEKDTTPMAIRVGVNICCSYVRSPTPSHTQSFQTLQINWEVYFFKEVFAHYYILRHYDSAWICISLYNTLCYIQNF